jgi:hypothetical protein
MILDLAVRHGPGTDEPDGGLLLEHLFIAEKSSASAPTAAAYDVWYRNKDFATPLNLARFLGNQEPIFAKWGYRDDTFGVSACATEGETPSKDTAYYVFKLNRGRRVGLTPGTKPSVKLIKKYTPKTVQAPVELPPTTTTVTGGSVCVPGWTGFCCETPATPFGLAFALGVRTLAQLMSVPSPSATQEFGCLFGSEANVEGTFRVVFLASATAGLSGFDFILDGDLHVIVPVVYASGVSASYQDKSPPPSPPFSTSGGYVRGAAVDLTAAKTLVNTDSLAQKGDSLTLLEADTKSGTVVTLVLGNDLNNRVFKNTEAVFAESFLGHFLSGLPRTRHRAFWTSIPNFPGTRVLTWDGYDEKARTFDLSKFRGLSGEELPVSSDMQWANPDFLYDQALLPPDRKSEFAVFLDEAGDATLFSPQRKDTRLGPFAPLKKIPSGLTVNPEVFFPSSASSVLTHGEYHVVNDGMQLRAVRVKASPAGASALEG